MSRPIPSVHPANYSWERALTDRTRRGRLQHHAGDTYHGQHRIDEGDEDETVKRKPGRMTKTEPGLARGVINPVIHLPKSVPKPTLFPNYTAASTAPRIGLGITGSEPGPTRGVIIPIVHTPKSVAEYTLLPSISARRGPRHNERVGSDPRDSRAELRVINHCSMESIRRRTSPTRSERITVQCGDRADTPCAPVERPITDLYLGY